MSFRTSSCATLLEGTGLVTTSVAMSPTQPLLDGESLQARIAEPSLQTCA